MKYLFGYKRGVVISEQEIDEDKLVITPYTLEAVDGNVKVSDSKNNKTYVYSLSAYGVKVTVNDFPNGNSIKYSVPLKGTSTNKVDTSSELATIIKDNLGSCKLEPVLDGITITLKCISGCNCSSSSEKSIGSEVSKTISGGINTATKAVSSFFGY